MSSVFFLFLFPLRLSLGPSPSLVASRTLTNRAVYKGWSGLTTTVQLDAVIEPLKDQANRLAVGFRKAVVSVGGMKVTFPHLQRFRSVSQPQAPNILHNLPRKKEKKNVQPFSVPAWLPPTPPPVFVASRG